MKFQDLLEERKELTAKTEKLKADYTEQEETYQTKSRAVQQIKEDLSQKRNTFQEAQTKLHQGYQYIEKLKSKKKCSKI